MSKSVPEKNVRSSGSAGSRRPPQKKEVLFHGIPVSPGIAMGPARRFGQSEIHAIKPSELKRIPDSQVEQEVELFYSAISKTEKELASLTDKMNKGGVDENTTDILEAHLLIVQDKVLHNDVIGRIRKNHISAEQALNLTIRHYLDVFSSMKDPYLKERADDVKDVANRILNNMTGMSRSTLESLTDPVVLVAKDLTPSDTALLDRKKVLGFSIENGSRTCHSAILARSMKIPAVVGMQRLYDKVQDGDSIIIDGYLGMVILHPEEETRDFYREKMAREKELYFDLLKESRLAAETLDGYRLKIAANVDGLQDAGELFSLGAEGIGLYRTEYLYMNSAMMPSEEVQFGVYRKLAESMKGEDVVIRTQDIGGDKNALFTSYHEANPFLGMRAVRLYGEYPNIFKTQIRAALRAAAFGCIRVMFPMVTCMSELNHLLELVETCKNELRKEKIPFDEHLKLGVMIEIPSAALIADEMAKKVDFFSIGTNDLIQYTLAVDRTNERISSLYDPAHRAVLRLIAMTVEAAHENGIPVAVCGEMAAAPEFVPFLIGLGVDELSMSPVSIAAIRKVIRRIRRSDAEAIARKALKEGQTADAMREARKLLERAVPDLVNVISHKIEQ